MAALSVSDLLKYDWRIQKFAEKYKNREPFELVSKQKVTLVYSDATFKILKNKKVPELQKLEFIDSRSKTKKYKISSFLKNEEFGGKPAGGGAGVGIEMREIDSINKQLNEIRSKTGLSYVPIKVKSKTYRAAKCVKTSGVPKSDFSILDENGSEIIWLSHKEGSTSRDFQQWGGMTEANIQNHPEAQKFIKKIQEMFPDGIPNATTVAKMIRDDNLKKMSIYGVNYKAGAPLGLQNVSVVLQGPVKLQKHGNVWKFNANHAHDNGEDIHGEFEPVMMAIYKGDRSNFGVQGARFAIQPKGSRKVTEWIK